MGEYLKQRGSTYYVQLGVPKHLQEVVGAQLLEQSLRTKDHAEANRRKVVVLAKWQQALRDIQATPEFAPLSPQSILSYSKELRAEVLSGDLRPIDADETLSVLVDRWDEANRGDSDGAEKVRRAYQVLRGENRETVQDMLKAYLGERRGEVTGQTLGDLERRIGAFVEWCGDSFECAGVDRRMAGRYVAEVVQKSEQAAPTRAKVISTLSTFYAWLVVRGVVDSNPWIGMSSTVKESKRGKEKARRAWTPDELVTVLSGFDRKHPVWALTVIALYTGMRREEIGQLKAPNCAGGALRLTEGKTSAAVREIPVHPVIRPLIDSLVESSRDGWLIPGLKPGGPDNKRTWYVGKKFGRDIRALEVTDPRLDFHALRGTFITAMEEAGVPVPTIQQIVGHERQGVTLGVYSSGVSFQVRAEAVQRVTFGEVDALVSSEYKFTKEIESVRG